jgi:hypothetical protein
MGRVLNIDLLEIKSTDGNGIIKAADFLVPFIGSKLSDFPYKQIKGWDEVQYKLCWQFYRIDKMLKKPIYEKHYISILNIKKGNKESVLY